MHRLISLIVVGVVFFHSPSVNALTPLEIARNKGIAWLIKNQNGDGSWGQELKIQATAEALLALDRYGMESSPFAQAGHSWLANQTRSSTDSLTHILKGLTITPTSLDPALLEQLQNAKVTYEKTSGSGQTLTYSCWGAYAGYSCNTLDTALVGAFFGRIRLISYQNDTVLLLRHLISKAVSSQSDGLTLTWWSPSLSYTGSVLASAHSLIALSRLRDLSPTNLDNYINGSINWLHTIQQDHGGFYENNVAPNGEDIYVTARVISALQIAQDSGNVAATQERTQTDLEQARHFLVARQLADGSWPQGTLATLAAIQLAPATQLVDSDNDGLPDAIEEELGSHPLVADSSPFFVAHGAAIIGQTVAESLAGGIQNERVDITLTANGGNGQYQWRLLSGQLPDGIRLDPSSGTLRGQANQAGLFNFMYQVTDSDGWRQDVLAQIHINAAVPTQHIPLLPLPFIVGFGFCLSAIAERSRCKRK